MSPLEFAPPPPPVPEPMDPVDRAWLEMDTPHNPMVVASIMEFENVTDPDALTRTLVERMLTERRFRQRVVERGGEYAWIEDDALHPGYHVHTRRLDGPRAEAKLHAAIAAELEHDLDRALPLWRICVFPRSRGRVTVLFRAHHAIADGVAMMQMMLALGDGVPPPQRDAPRPRPRRHGPLAGVIQRLETFNAALENLTAVVVDDLRHPRNLRRQLAGLRETLAAIGRVILLPEDHPRHLRRPPSGRRAVVWTDNVALGAVRRIARSQGITLNDVFLTALTGAFGRYLRQGGKPLPEGQNLRVAVPVNLRGDGEEAIGNSFGLVLVDLPVGLEGWHARLDVVVERMASLKKSPEAKAVLLTLAAFGQLPATIERQLVGLLGNKAAAVVSNLPGPREALRVDGARLANVVFWPPQAAGIGIGVSLLSYAGHVTVGVSADTALVPQPRHLIDAFHAELEQMLGASPIIRPAARRRWPAIPANGVQPCQEPPEPTSAPPGATAAGRSPSCAT
ncbi:MAG: wax ester/triacylglycerol synthase family O-acyltransferase [Gammaproteobacteria bacterium]